MPYDEGLAERLRDAYSLIDGVTEKKMFGGIAFMVNGNMSCGIVKETLMVRVGPYLYGEALGRPYAREMDFTGRSMKGFVFVSHEGFESDSDLEGWVQLSYQFVSTLPAK